MNTITLRVGGVPEHFNCPIHLAIEDGAFLNQGLTVEWKTFTGGTGQMCKALRDGEVDICILLTEGIIRDITRGNPSRIISNYVISPLTWGIHTSRKNDTVIDENFFNRRFAVSRYGSGSHLMPQVQANEAGERILDDRFVVINNLEGALKSLANLETDIFYWEKYTTKPYVDSGQLKRIGEYQSPWPCFVAAATQEILHKAPKGVVRFLRTVHDYTDHFMSNPENIFEVSRRYQLPIEDVERWYHSTEWATHGWVNNKMISNVLYHLKKAKLVETAALPEDIIWQREK